MSLLRVKNENLFFFSIYTCVCVRAHAHVCVGGFLASRLFHIFYDKKFKG